MSESQDQMRQAVREVGQEISRAMESAGGLARQAMDDLSRLVGAPVVGRPRRPADDPVERIRQLGRLRDEGLISEGEFQAKKAELLSRL